jgi:2-oxoglutarate ferredoxin oxidoreductase subunit delta
LAGGLHLLSKKTKTKYTEKKKKSKYPKVTFMIFDKWCKRCGICIELCAHNVFTDDEEGYPRAVKPVECNLCGFCITRCPDFALRIIEGADTQKSK